MTRNASLEQPPLFRLTDAEGPRLTLESDTGARAYVFVLEEDLVRLAVLPAGAFCEPRSWTLAPGADDGPLEGRSRLSLEGFSCPSFLLDVSEPDRVTVQTGRVRLRLRLLNLQASWEVRLEDRWVDAARDRPTQAYDFGWWGGTVRHYLARAPEEQYFGLGERSGPLDRAGRRLRLSNLDAMGYDAQTSDPLYKHIPFYITRRRDSGLAFGLFYDTLADCVFDFGCEHSNYHGPYRSFSAEAGDVDLYFLAGPGLADVVRRFTWLTGRPAQTPDWALHYSGSTMSYTDAPDAAVKMAGFLDDLERYGVPCGSFHLSSGYTSIGDRRYVFHWNRDKFPDPAAFAASYRAAGLRLIANIKPVLLQDHPQFEPVKAAGLFLKDADGRPVLEQFWEAPGAYLDFTNPDTHSYWKAQVAEQLLAYGVAATWNDNNEFEITNPAALAHGFGAPYPAAEKKPLQTLLMLRASRDAQRAYAPDAPPFLVSRAGAAGLQRYAQTWSGDNYTSWKTLKWNLPMGLGLALSGVSNIGHDVGGFAGPPPDPELFARWMGFGVFMPRFTVHSWNEDGSASEPWMHPEVLASVLSLLRLRELMIPYLAAVLARYRRDYQPAVRPTFFDFPGDEACFEGSEEFMLGDLLLSAPVLEPQQSERALRLPGREDWIDGWTGETYAGGSVVCRPAPLERPPFFVRARPPDGCPAELVSAVRTLQRAVRTLT